MEQTVELVVRKKEAKFVEKLFRYLGYDFKHDAFKRIIYNEASYDTPIEEKIKAYYDGYCFLLTNYKNPLTEGLLKKFIYILKGKEADDDLITRIATAFFDICSHHTMDEAIEFHLKAYQEIVEYDEEDKLIITLMLLNYALLKAGIPSLAFLETDLRKYKPLRDEYFNKGHKEIYSFLFEIIKKAKTQDKEYYLCIRNPFPTGSEKRICVCCPLRRKKFSTPCSAGFPPRWSLLNRPNGHGRRVWPGTG